MLIRIVVIFSFFTSVACLATGKGMNEGFKDSKLKTQPGTPTHLQPKDKDPETIEVTQIPLIEIPNQFGNLVQIGETKKRSSKRKLRLVFMSDIHIHGQSLGIQNQSVSVSLDSMVEKIPNGDILIISGDLTGEGDIKDLTAFRNFLDTLYATSKFKYILFIPGNHDRILDQAYYIESGYRHHRLNNPQSVLKSAQEILFKELPTNVICLLDTSVEIAGYHFYGTPWVYGFKNWGFSVSEEELEKKWSQIPVNTDILITHMPPFSHGDYEGFFNNRSKQKAFSHVGSKSLLEQSLKVQPLIHAFGHIHEGYGVTQRLNYKTFFINSATCDEDYQPIQKAIVIDLPKK